MVNEEKERCKELLILTVDVGGTNEYFSAIKGGKIIGESFFQATNAHNLALFLTTLKAGLSRLYEMLDESPDAISLAFPGPADYRQGVVFDVPNLPAFHKPVPLTSILEHEFGIPVYLNNDGNLFALGESKHGFLPWINKKLEEAGNEKRYQNLLGITLGTGFGVGIVINGQPLIGDTNSGAEGWKLRNMHYPYSSVEDSVSVRALKRMYAEQIAMQPEKAPNPHQLYQIATGKAEGVREAALEAYLRYGDVLGDSLASLITTIDGLVVIGGGLRGAFPVFSRSMFDQLNGSFEALNGKRESRLIQKVFNLEQEYQLEEFLTPSVATISIPGTEKSISFERQKKCGIGCSRMGSSESIAMGAYDFAVDQFIKPT
jgi:glucokinase